LSGGLYTQVVSDEEMATRDGSKVRAVPVLTARKGKANVVECRTRFYRLYVGLPMQLHHLTSTGNESVHVQAHCSHKILCVCVAGEWDQRREGARRRAYPYVLGQVLLLELLDGNEVGHRVLEHPELVRRTLVRL
jgi:hypothetical protein